MENTGKVFFENDGAPQWYLAVSEKWVGPMTAQDVYEKILKQEISWAHFVWRKGQANWQRICDVPTFQAAVPGQPKGMPSQTPGASTAGAAKAAKKEAASTWQEANKRIWFLYYNDSQFGPFTEEEIRRFLNLGKIHGRVHAWKEGMNGWNRIEKIGGFEIEISEADRIRQEKKAGKADVKAPKAPSNGEESDPAPQAKYKDQRKTPRRPLLARIVLAHQDEVIVGVCRDVSIGGMQVLTAKIPGLPGSRIKLNVSPAGDAAPANPKSKKKAGLKPFVAEGMIVRLLEDGRGFSFRFEKLPPESKEVIEKYIAAELEG